MLRPAIRFHPPAVPLTGELRWMLRRAFGPPADEGEIPAPLSDPAAALALARRFELATRIAARCEREMLAAELGEEGAAQLARDRAVVAAMGLQLINTAQQVAAVAAARSVPLCGLKFLALEGSGRLVPGSRAACDADLLVPAAAADALWRDLLAAGFRASGLPEYDHQLPTLVAPAGGAVEIHRILPGLRLDGRRSATYEALAERGLLVPVRGCGENASAPVPEVQAAHTLVHGLGQHGFWPLSYSLFKMVADLADLGGGGSACAGLSEEMTRWIEADVPRDEMAAACSLCHRLVAGEDPDGWPRPERLLLDHVLAGRLDADYEKALRLGLFRHQPSDRPAPVRLVRSLVGAVILSDAQIDAIYGPPRGRWGYLGRRLARPFDLLLRLGAYARRALRLRGSEGG